jgi:predicted Fe-Mo cluster-binding NifX family protein
MKVCIPVEKNNGVNSRIYDHFGSAPFFLIFVTDSEDFIKEINNGDIGHEHGKCQPLKALKGEQVDAILVGGIGAGALMRLKEQGIKAYKPKPSSILENIQMLVDNQLGEYTIVNSCSHNHSNGGGCSH